MINYSDISHRAASTFGKRILRITHIDAPTIARLGLLAKANHCPISEAGDTHVELSGTVQDLIGFSGGLARLNLIGTVDQMNLSESLACASERDGSDLAGLEIVKGRPPGR